MNQPTENDSMNGSLVEIVNRRWMTAMDEMLCKHPILCRWRRGHGRFGRLVAEPPSDNILKAWLRPGWWDSFDAQTITVTTVEAALDPLQATVGFRDPKSHRLLPMMREEVGRLRPNVFCHAVAPLVDKLASGKIRYYRRCGFDR